MAAFYTAKLPTAVGWNARLHSASFAHSAIVAGCVAQRQLPGPAQPATHIQPSCFGTRQRCRSVHAECRLFLGAVHFDFIWHSSRL